MLHNRFIRTAALVLLVAALSVGGGYLGSRLGGGRPDGAAIAQLSPRRVDDGSATPASLTTPLTADDVSAAFQERFRTVARTVLPEVVEINVVSTVTQTVPGSPFDFFFGPNRGESTPQQRRFQQRGLGSGVLVGKNDRTVYVLTNNHVVGEADEIEVVLHDGRAFQGSLVGSDELTDLALVSFESSEDVPIATLGDSDSLEIGDWVFAVGNPLGFESTVTAGIVSAIERDARPGSGMSGVTSYIQTDAAINRGNSGGALVNLNGEVVGINTWIASQSGGSIGLGFAVPVNVAKRAINDFIETGNVQYSWLGVLAGSPDPDAAEELGIAGLSGAFVSNVYLDSPAGKGGLQPGDLITRVGEIEIDGSRALVRAIATLPPNEQVRLTVRRDGSEEIVVVTTSRRDESSGSDAATLWPGFSVTGLDEELRERLSTPAGVDGVVVAGVAAETAAQTSGIREGDVIMTINGARVTSVRDFYRELSDAFATDDDELSFRVRRGDQTLILGFLRPDGRTDA